MPILVVPNVWAVGMHHWGARELVVGAGYSIAVDEGNKHDSNAVEVLDEKRRKAYLKRENAALIAQLLRMNVSEKWLLKPKEPAITKSKRKGPEQRCNIGCKISDRHVDNVVKYLKEKQYCFELK